MNNPLSLSRPHLSSYFKPSFTDFSFIFICYTPANRSSYSSYTFLKSAWEKEFLKMMAFHYDTKTVIVKSSCSFFSGWIMNKRTFNKFLQHKTHVDSSFNLCIQCKKIFTHIRVKYLSFILKIHTYKRLCTGHNICTHICLINIWLQSFQWMWSSQQKKAYLCTILTSWHGNLFLFKDICRRISREQKESIQQDLVK